MSRSYKKHSRVKDPANKGMKKYANKKVRHTENIPNGKAYKKVFCSWDISDWNWYWSREQAIKEWEAAQYGDDIWSGSWIRDHFETLEKYLIYWEKCTKRK